GMSEKLGPVIFRHDGNVFLGRDLVQMREHSEVTTREIDEEIKRILEEAENKAINILTENLDKLHKLANALLEKETLKSEEIDEILGIEKQEQKGENDGQKENREGSGTDS
ncbi:MAG TPA: cell division protein FtsH, partial [Candidatus Ratteibacteria bacterium]|nr:cell division protein FtsH [Candidatus Ratteibacteria bacterium]